MALSFSRFVEVYLRGLAQVAFAEKPVAGVFVIIAIAFVSPWGALGAAVGALTGLFLARIRIALTEAEWEAGLAGPNPAIAGILWGNAFSAGEAGFGILALILFTCFVMERAFRPISLHFRIPVLSAPAVAAAYLVNAVISSFGKSFWHLPASAPFGDAGIFAAIFLVGLAMLTKSRIATLQVTVLTLSAALISGWYFKTGIFGPVGLWAFAVAPAVFALHAVFLAGSAAGGWAGLFAAFLGVAFWAGWVAGPLLPIGPPLLFPFILAVWLILLIIYRFNDTIASEPGLWLAVEEIRSARNRKKPVVALTGAGISTASGIPDYVSGNWLRPGTPADVYSFEKFQASFQCRQEYWNACDEFRHVAEKALPNPAHHALAEMERCGWLATTITQNVDGLHQDAGAQSVIELHGQIDKVRCLSCGRIEDWPTEDSWMVDDLFCQSCSGLLKPALIAMGERIPVLAWIEAENAAENCGVMIVVGSQIAISSALELINIARKGGAKIIIITIGEVAHPPGSDDIVIKQRAETLLPALAVFLDCPVSLTVET